MADIFIQLHEAPQVRWRRNLCTPWLVSVLCINQCTTPWSQTMQLLSCTHHACWSCLWILSKANRLSNTQWKVNLFSFVSVFTLSPDLGVLSLYFHKTAPYFPWKLHTQEKRLTQSLCMQNSRWVQQKFCICQDSRNGLQVLIINRVLIFRLLWKSHADFLKPRIYLLCTIEHLNDLLQA